MDEMRRKRFGMRRERRTKLEVRNIKIKRTEGWRIKKRKETLR